MEGKWICRKKLLKENEGVSEMKFSSD
jgi:hypothetical protein